MAEVDSAMPISSGKLLPLVELRYKDRYVTIRIIIAKRNCVFHGEMTFRFPRCVSHVGSSYQLQVRSASGLGRATVSEHKGRVLIVRSYYHFVQMTCRT